MEPSPSLLLSKLPEYRDEWQLVSNDQTVNDIIRDVLSKHKEFSPYYDKIALYFDRGDTAETCDELYRFCKRYLRYREEPEDIQTTALPTGLLTRGFCDCKGYSSFIAGCLDGIGRLTGKKIDWAYRFASYKALDPSPHHVFVVVNDPNEGEIWIDPTPRSRDMSPSWQLDKTVKTMPLYSNISGFRGNNSRALGIASQTVLPRTTFAPQMAFSTAPWPSSFGEPFRYYLGLDNYRDYSGDRNINESSVAAALNALIAKGPAPGHTVDGGFVKWVYDNSIRSWNFYYPGGVEPGFDEARFIPGSFSWVDSAGHTRNIVPPHWVVTPDHRVTIDHDVQLDDYRNWLIHILTAAAQKYINQYDESPFPLKPADVKNFSQAYTGNPGNPNASILKEWRAASDVAKFIDVTTSFVTNTFLKIVGSVPRNAFLALVGINLFHMATDLQTHINAGEWDRISSKWKALGGDPDKLRNTISHGSGAPETDDTTQTINSTDQISGVSIGNPAVVGAIIAAATPVIVAFAQWLSHQSVHSQAGSYVDALNAQNPAGNYSMVNGQLYSNGVPVSMNGSSDPAVTKNILLTSGAIAGASYILFNWKRKGKKKRILLPLAIGAGAYFLLKSRAQQTGGLVLAPGTSPQVATSGSGLTQLLQSIPGLLQNSSPNPTTTENTPGGTYSAGDSYPLNPEYSGAAVAGWEDGNEPYFND